MELILRPVQGDEELLEFQHAVATGFHDVLTSDRIWEMARSHLDRSVAAFDGDEIVGTGINYTFDLVVPGGASLPMAGVSAITTRPTHTRRGVLRAVLGELTANAMERGEPLMGLTASEHTIYGRFGYGVATHATAFEIERRRTALRRAPRTTGRLRIVDEAAARALLPEVFARVMRDRNGTVSRPASWWAHDYFENPHDDDEKWFYVVHEAVGGVADGYATYTVKRDWTGGVPRGQVEVAELVASDPEVRFALFDHFLSLDLVDIVLVRFLAVDDPVQLLLTDPRRMRVVEHRDRLWLRLLDVPRCLGARTYRGDGSLVVEVVDEAGGHAAGRFRLEAQAGQAACRPDDGAMPDLRLGVAELGACYLGGTRWSALDSVGLVEECTPGAVRRADEMFGVEATPVSIAWF